MEEKLVIETVMQLRQNNIDKVTDNNIKCIFKDINKLLSENVNIKYQNNQVVGDLVKGVKDLLEAYKSGDIVYLADVLEYEILEIADRLM